MESLPTPPVVTGLDWRPWTLEDAPALARHAVRVHEAERLESVPGTDLYRWLAQQAGFDAAADTLAAFDAAGEAHAEAKVWAPITEAGARAFLWIDAAPPHTGLRAFLIEWAEARSRQILDSVDPGLERVIRISIEEHRADFRSQVEAAGFHQGRSFVVMRRSLDELPAPPAVPSAVQVMPWSTDVSDGVRLASNEAFADHWGSQPIPTDMWQGMYPDSDTFRGDLSFVAMDEGRVVAFCLVEVSEEDNAQRGYAEVYVDRVGTVRSHRRLGLASHLLVGSMQAAAAAGFVSAALDVDETSHTSATEVYRRIGFEVADRSITYLKEA